MRRCITPKGGSLRLPQRVGKVVTSDWCEGRVYHPRIDRLFTSLTRVERSVPRRIGNVNIISMLRVVKLPYRGKS